MKFKPRHIVEILLVLTTLLTTTYCEQQIHQTTYIEQNPAKVSGPKKAINTIKVKTKTGFARVYGKRTLKEDDVNTLLQLIHNKGDLIKIVAHRKLVKLYLNAKSNDENHTNTNRLVVALIESSTELVRYYGIIKSRKLKSTYNKGMEYATQCEILTNDIGMCNKWKAQLIQTYYSFLKINYSTKKQLNEAIRYANTAAENQEMMKFIEAKVACEKKNVSRIVNAVNKNAANNVNCVEKLLPFIENFSKLGSFHGEFHYLLGQSYEKQNDVDMAIEHYHTALDGYVYDKKTRHFNEKAQVQFEKLYLRKNSV